MNGKSQNTRDLDYEAPFRIMLEKYLPTILDKLVKENEGDICSIIKRAVDKEIRRTGQGR